MRRTKYAILLLILSLVLAGCGAFTPSEQELQDSIPTLSLTAGRYRYQIPTGGYSWSVYNRFGSGSHMATDTAHPLQAVDDLTAVSLTGGETVTLTFSRTPDTVEVTYWSVGDEVGSQGTSLETSFLDDSFLFTAPEETTDLVFQITAQWTSYEDVGGTVSYPFTTAVSEE